MQSPAPHVERLDLLRRRSADGIVMTFTNQEIIPDHPAERRQRQNDLAMRLGAVMRQPYVEVQPVFLDAEDKTIGSARRMKRLEIVTHQKIGDRLLPFPRDHR